jgi:parallel beta-helix repeat protein
MQNHTSKHRFSHTFEQRHFWGYKLLIASCTLLVAGAWQSAEAKTLCVKPGGAPHCYGKIQAAVNAASDFDVINVAAGTYKEDVTIWKPLSLIGTDDDTAVIDATGLPNGILVDGFDHPGLYDVTIAGFTVKNALYEGILVVSSSDVTIRDNTVINNDKEGPVFGSGPACNGQPAYETDESGDCGGAIHLIGTIHSLVSTNLITGNADGVLISDETAESRDNVLIHNIIKDNPLECGIVLASHPPVGSSAPHYAPHYGVDHNTVADNYSAYNGVQVGGAGAGMFSDGNGPGRVANNVIIHNQLIGNGLGGVDIHTHVGPAFGAPADDMDQNMIIGNYIAGNLADLDDTRTPGSVGININSGDGGSPILGTTISRNTIRDEDVDVAINTPAKVDLHLNDLLGGKVGVADVCAFDASKACTGSIDATQNYWGCPSGPGNTGCSTASGADIRFVPALTETIHDHDDPEQ